MDVRCSVATRTSIASVDPVGLDQKHVGDLAAGRAIEQVEIGAVETPEERVAQRDRDAPLQIAASTCEM